MKPKPVLFGVLIGLVVSGTLDAEAQSAGGARMAAMGNASVASEGFWSVFCNQAGMATLSQPHAGISGTQPMLVPSLHDALMGVVYPVGQNVFGITFHQQGNSNYREQNAGLAFARKFGHRVRTGLRFDYVHLSLSDGYGQSNGVTFEAGVQILVSQAMVLGIHVFNPVAENFIANKDEKPQGRILFGIAIRLTDPFLIIAELEKDLDFRPALKAGMEYKLNQTIVLRLGYSTLPPPSGMNIMPLSSSLGFGMGMNIGNFYLDAAGSIHSSLGWTPTVSMHYILTRDIKEE